MANVRVDTNDGKRAGQTASETTAGRRRWFRIRIATDEGCYLGHVRLEKDRSALNELIDDDRAYLAVWNARREGTGDVVEFLAINKAAIRYVVVDGQDPDCPSQAA